MTARYGDVRCVAGGQALTVRYGNLAWEEVKRKLGQATEIGCLLEARKSSDRLLVLVREGLATHHPELTLAQVRELYDDRAPTGDELSLPAAVWEAVKLSLPELRKVVEGSGAGPKEPRGRRSTRRRSGRA